MGQVICKSSMVPVSHNVCNSGSEVSSKFKSLLCCILITLNSDSRLQFSKPQTITHLQDEHSEEEEEQHRQNACQSLNSKVDQLQNAISLIPFHNLFGGGPYTEKIFAILKITPGNPQFISKRGRYFGSS
jgi:hypothetical protein